MVHIWGTVQEQTISVGLEVVHEVLWAHIDKPSIILSSCVTV